MWSLLLLIINDSNKFEIEIKIIIKIHLKILGNEFIAIKLRIGHSLWLLSKVMLNIVFHFYFLSSLLLLITTPANHHCHLCPKTSAKAWRPFQGSSQQPVLCCPHPTSFLTVYRLRPGRSTNHLVAYKPRSDFWFLPPDQIAFYKRKRTKTYLNT